MSGFMKRYPDAAAAEVARYRTVALAAEGVPTPPVLAFAGEASLCFAYVEGRTGRELTGNDLAPLLTVLARLHRARMPHLPSFDPLRRVRSRLGLGTKLPVRDILAAPVPKGDATLHGDLHVGQFIRGGDGAVWIVDLDDLALGPAEADLANFTAHLATSVPEHPIPGWVEQVCTAWKDIGQPLNCTIFAPFLRFALLRRHLKLREAGRPDFEADILAYLRDSSNFSIL